MATTIIPFARCTSGDRIVSGLFEKMKAEGKLQLVFGDGRVKSGTELAEFLGDTESRASYLVFHRGEICAFFWLDVFGYRAMQAHYCTFQTVGRVNFVSVAHSAMDYVLGKKGPGGHLVDIVVTMAPLRNEKGLRFAELCGGKLCGDLPHMEFDASTGAAGPCRIFYYTREVLNELRRK